MTRKFLTAVCLLALVFLGGCNRLDTTMGVESVANWFSSVSVTNATFEHGGGDWTGPYTIIPSYLGHDSALQLADPTHGDGAWLTQPIDAFVGRNALTYYCDGLSIYTLNLKDAAGNIIKTYSEYHWHLFSDTIDVPEGAVTGEFNIIPHENSNYSTFDWFELIPIGAPPPPPPPPPPEPDTLWTVAQDDIPKRGHVEHVDIDLHGASDIALSLEVLGKVRGVLSYDNGNSASFNAGGNSGWHGFAQSFVVPSGARAVGLWFYASGNKGASVRNGLLLR